VGGVLVLVGVVVVDEAGGGGVGDAGGLWALTSPCHTRPALPRTEGGRAQEMKIERER
jgi:hypothetical protein